MTLDWIKKRPARARKLYYGRSRAAAICIECVGSASEAKRCPATQAQRDFSGQRTPWKDQEPE